MKRLQMTIYINEADISGDVPLHEAVVRRLHHADVAGAVVVRGMMGYGKHGKVHRKRLLGVSDDNPVVITAVDTEERIREVLPAVRALVKEGLITVQEVELI